MYVCIYIYILFKLYSFPKYQKFMADMAGGFIVASIIIFSLLTNASLNSECDLIYFYKGIEYLKL